MILYQATTSYFCVGLIIKDDRIIEVAPIIKWAKGETISYFANWLSKKNGTLKKIKVEDDSSNSMSKSR